MPYKSHLVYKILNCDKESVVCSVMVCLNCVLHKLIIAGNEWDYVVLSTVRSLPRGEIEPNPWPGWCMKHMGFITDAHQINVAITRAKSGLIIIG